MDEKLKQQLLDSAENLTKVSLDEVIKIAEVFAANTASPVDDGIVSAVKMLKVAFLDGLIDKIDGKEG